ncbi:MAG: rod shape-determining protein MreC [Alphaproteobacteria bacterium]|jgi:rod shape-determining protein MreC|nr:rod shape-determining protein MreC [Alphaproteobacteria bacterium]
MPARAVAQRSGYLVLVSASILLLVLGRSDDDAVIRFRAAVTDLLAPVLGVLAEPVEAAKRFGAALDGHWQATQDNQRLRGDIERLMHWQQVARRLEQENAVLRAQLNLRPEPAPHYITARVIADTGGAFVRTLIVNAGSRNGVLKGQAAISGAGVIGRIAEVGERASRLLLLTDLNSRVPVVVEGSRMRAVLAGDNSARPRLIYLPARAQLSPGDRIVTSGHGGVFPPGLPVGTVTTVDDGEVLVRPLVDWDRLEYATVLRYELARMDEDEEWIGD